MALLRSKSASHVAGPSSTPTTRQHSLALGSSRHPKIQRHASALAVTSLAFASSSTSVRNGTRSGHQTPRADRQDDPFSLAGFFPSALASSVYDAPTHVEWDWLHYEVDESDLVGRDSLVSPPPTSSGYASPVSSSEDEEWALPATPPLLASPMFDRGEDEVCGETIRREDKLGVLSLPNPFSMSKDAAADVGRFMQPPPTLLSPYSEDDPLDNDALYNALCALRKAHAISESASVVGESSSGGLFSSVEEEGGVVDSDLETLGTWGLGRLLDMLPL